MVDRIHWDISYNYRMCVCVSHGNDNVRSSHHRPIYSLELASTGTGIGGVLFLIV